MIWPENKLPGLEFRLLPENWHPWTPVAREFKLIGLGARHNLLHPLYFKILDTPLASGHTKPRTIPKAYFKLLLLFWISYNARLNPSYQYAVKVQRSLAPLSRFRGSHIPSAHEQQCCTFQSYANSVRSPMKFTSKIYIAWTTFLGSTTTDHVITSCDVGL